jgi:carboxyl-terminal processing protease
MSRWNLAWLLGCLAITLVGVSILFAPAMLALLGAQAPDTELGQKHANIRLLVDVLEEVQHKYVKKLDQKQMRELVENMVNSGLERLDPHSQFINEDEFRQFQKTSRGKFGGIGVKIGIDRNTGQVLVESPMVGTPAYEAGVQAGDLILKVDGKATDSVSLKKVVEMIQGEPGEKVTLTVLHEGEKKPVDIPITRAEIMIDSVLGDRPLQDPDQKWEFTIDADNGIAYIRLVAFTETTVQELTKVVEHLQKHKMRGLVLDLRGNPGGLLKAAVDVSSMFLPEGKRVVSTKGRNQREEVYDARPPRGFEPQTTYPIAILINRYSASASEIVAAALQDHLRAIIVGERSFGKGSVQNVIGLESGKSALKLTTASYWRPNGKNIHRFPDAKDEEEWGVSPSKGYEVKLSDEDRIAYFKYRRDRDVVRRNGVKAGPKEGEAKKKSEPFRDRALDRAVEYIRGELKKGQAGLPAPAGDAEALFELRRPAFALPPANLLAIDDALYARRPFAYA